MVLLSNNQTTNGAVILANKYISSTQYNLTLTSQSGNVEVSAVLNLDNQTWNTPTYTAGKTKIYSYCLLPAFH